MKGPSLFLRFYLTLLLVLALPMLLFGAAELLTRQEERDSWEPAGLVKFTEWTLSGLLEDAESMPEDVFSRRLREAEEGSGLKFYVRYNKNGETDKTGGIFSPALPERDPVGLFPSPGRPVVVPAVSRSGRTELVAELYPFSHEQRRPFFRELAMLLSALIGAVTSWLLARGFLKPLSKLRATTARLAAGDFSARVEENIAHRKDEIGDLSVSFNGMAERLAELIGAQKRLLADVSHEIRSPLQRMEIALALARGAETTELEDCLDRLETEVGRIDAMVEELLLLTRAESRMVPDDEIIHLEALVSNVIEDIRFEEREARPEIELEAATADKLLVRGNPILLERALRNILHNAVRYAPEDRITVRACEKDGQAEISVADCGNGVPDGELENIFLPWYRANAAAQREGMGLGLNISRRIAKSSGGSVSAANNPGGGLTVTIRLPLAGGLQARRG